MRRDDREITDPKALDEIIHRSPICHIGFSERDKPYVLPFCFGYEDRVFYIHCADAGRKLDILRLNNAVCVSCESDVEVVESLTPCSCSLKYRSGVAFGYASIVEDAEAKRRALDAIMKHYSDRADFTYTDGSVAEITILRIDIRNMTGKQSGY